MFVNDFADLGYFPLQDHAHGQDGTPVSARQMIAGCRITRMTDPNDSDDPADSVIQVGREYDMGTLGDIHPWLFWQTRERSARGMGSWAQSFATIAVDSDPYYAAFDVQPIRNELLKSDSRYRAIRPNWPACFPRIPKGALTIVMPGTDEADQHDNAYWADPRLIAPNTEGPGQCGTLVCDLQGSAEICMDGSSIPGVGGRHARLQTIFRVIAVGTNEGMGNLGAAGNVVALNYTRTGVEGTPGFGAIFGQMDAGSSGPITGGPSGGGPITGGRSGPITGPRGATLGSTATGSGSFGGESLTGDDEEQYAPQDFGEFAAKPKSGHGVALMAHLGAGGPIHCGNRGDKHRHGTDRDGHPINAAHISTEAFFYRDQERDAPIAFEGDYPYPSPLPIPAPGHLSYAGMDRHSFKGQQASGKWRIWCETPDISPLVPPPDDPRTPQPPDGPGGRGGGGPITGGPTGPGGPNPPGPGGPNPPGPGKPTTPGGPSSGGKSMPPKPPGPITHGGGEGGQTGGGNPGPITGGGTPGPITGPRGGSGGQPSVPCKEPRDYPDGPGPGGYYPPGQFPGEPPGGGYPTGPWPPLPGSGTGPTTGPRGGIPPEPPEFAPWNNQGKGKPRPPRKGKPSSRGGRGGSGGGGSGGGSGEPTPPKPFFEWPGGVEPMPDWPGYFGEDRLGRPKRIDDMLPPNPDAPWPMQGMSNGGRNSGGSDYKDPRADLGRWSGLSPWERLPQQVPGLVERVGTVSTEDVALYTLFRPMAQGFAALNFRPQLTVSGYPNFEHNPQLPTSMYFRDEEARPQVLAMHAWGAQSVDEGEFDYTEDPSTSRARGGTGDGGILYHPPRFELEDYYGLNDRDVSDVSSDVATTGYVLAAPGVCFALGLPNPDGTLQANAVGIMQAPTTGTPLVVTHNGTEVLHAIDDGTDVIVSLGGGGHAAIVVPVGTTAQRPSTPVAGMIRSNTSAGNHVIEYYDGNSAAWTTLAAGGGGASWGSITGTLSAQTDLQGELDAKVDEGAVTSSGLTMATARMLGRSTASTGAIEEITIGTGLSLTAGELSATGGGGGELTDGDKGDITVTDDGDTWTIDNDAVTLAKMANALAKNVVLGSGASGGPGTDYVELTLGTGLSMSGTVLDAPQIATNTAAIATNAADIATNATDIATNAGDIATNAADIATNAADIAALYPRVLDTSFGAPSATVASTAYTAIYSYSIPANTLGAVRLALRGDMLQNDTAQSLKIRVELGGTQIWGAQASGSLTQSATRRPWRLNLDLASTGTGTQHLNFDWQLGYFQAAGSGIGRYYQTDDDGLGSAQSAKDETTSLTLEVKFAFNSSATAADVRMFSAVLEQLA
jgi:hypothetical protein